MFIDYTATRELVGSGADKLETKIRPPKRLTDIEKDGSVSLSGVGRETQLHRYEFRWQIKTVPVPIANLPRWREFHGSTLADETFSIDIFGTEASPDNVITASVVDGTWVETRLSPIYYQFEFEIIER